MAPREDSTRLLLPTLSNPCMNATVCRHGSFANAKAIANASIIQRSYEHCVRPVDGYREFANEEKTLVTSKTFVRLDLLVQSENMG